jgi:hypothetical protein
MNETPALMMGLHAEVETAPPSLMFFRFTFVLAVVDPAPDVREVPP